MTESTLTWYEKIYYPLWRKWNFLINIPKEILWFLQRGRRGWADCDTWSLDGYLVSWLPEALRHLAKNSHGCPPDLYDEACSGEDQCHKWAAVLEEMATGFELMRAWDEDYPKVVGDQRESTNGKGEYYYSFSDPEWVEKFRLKEKEVYAKFERSKELLSRYWGNLWD